MNLRSSFNVNYIIHEQREILYFFIKNILVHNENQTTMYIKIHNHFRKINK